ncbi:Na+/H+ antiporter NhaC family protein [Treponema phagedenis]|uniref:Na+/H+ antiporter NhaC family protein n=1 Tax=Treponema phagedenis TaxID=162 RepID=A0A0B7GWK6_TREPH|nr:Na+/H+ antiporter NhaC family protein [Treponema phagedenis]NVP25055.1 Na+/H+ antiporter NhaC family protein [Treponema phagedenis]QEJ94033.1 Na+/H+ antiporter NhaC family protein [Treponema phagedenis]QEJ97169.1 Na+/H+ antiporter NhaC family protein [Treponema phagedenis]QEK01959.1 Na+/H+ antiporter NhaC family protein [Treponema phagedenis]QEK02641.1 Na+/H+ antiporter NhaC family protein [Treponema phagedenis]
MEHFGIWGIIPPVLTIILALVTKDVIISLFLGVFSGVLIVAGGNPLVALINATDLLAESLNDGWNIRIFLFCAMLGGLVGLLSKTGAAVALGHWTATKIKGRKSSLLTAWFLGLIVFIDDYFNSLAVGTIMRPITDKQRISRAKLSYILDSTAAPVCILAPVSSWVVTVMSVVKASDGFTHLGISEFEFFLRSIPYNIYAILTLLMVVVLSVTYRDFGPMKESERLAMEKNILFNEELYGAAGGDVPAETNPRAKAVDMILPIVVLIISAVFFFPFTTWMRAIDGEKIYSVSEAMASMSLSTAFVETDASVALFYASIFTVVFTYIYFIARRLLNLHTASAALKDGIASMVPALIILTMAWTIGTVIRATPDEGGLGLAKYLAQIVTEGHFPFWLLPAVMFIVSALIGFSTGSSWGTFTIMIPITIPIAIALAEIHGLQMSSLLNATMISVAAVLSGAVFGDHASPISDTTILSSTGAGCPHLEHVTTQLPYATFVSACAFVGFLVGGITLNPLIGWVATLIVFTIGMIFLPNILSGKLKVKK